MKVLLLGGGGREHALAWKILQSPALTSLAVTHENPGFPTSALRVEGEPDEWAVKHGIDLCVVGPDAPLAEGIADRMIASGIATFGPQRAAARLEWSKGFAKDFMARRGIPTAGFSVHDDAASAHAAVRGPMVVKADGLALGKGVLVAATTDETHQAIDHVMGGAFGRSGDRVVLEERMEGPELSVFALSDGERVVFLPPCRDHKRRFDGDVGPNTGGMGAYCPVPGIDDALIARIEQEIVRPTIAGIAKDAVPFQGVLYVGLMLTRDGPKVIEFNARFGDPECQPQMMMLDEDFLLLLDACARGRLTERKLVVRPGAAACVVMVAGSYPGAVQKGAVISGLDVPADSTDPRFQESQVFFAGARRRGTDIVVDGGRVLGVTAHGRDLAEAVSSAYARVAGIQFEGCDHRQDIGGAR